MQLGKQAEANVQLFTHVYLGEQNTSFEKCKEVFLGK